ncbi:MAG: hypothetical protein BWY21_00372 [Parcubacteria group bacterium ADurb.Bin216]|nr:MAG: hypothetical protein BWY21_00372 [Parcubacteria group bacterium ADurb.Bin216]
MSIKHLQFDNSATIAFGSITNTYQNLLALSDDTDILFIANTTNAPMLFSIPSGYNSYKDIRMPASTSMSIDCRSNSKRIAKGTIQIKYVSAPTSGEVTITAAR